MQLQPNCCPSAVCMCVSLSSPRGCRRRTAQSGQTGSHRCPLSSPAQAAAGYRLRTTLCEEVLRRSHGPATPSCCKARVRLKQCSGATASTVLHPSGCNLLQSSSRRADLLRRMPFHLTPRSPWCLSSRPCACRHSHSFAAYIAHETGIRQRVANTPLCYSVHS